MKAVIYEKYGSPKNLKLVEMNEPSIDDNHILVKVKAVSINSADWRYLVADPFLLRFMGAGVFKPKVQTLGSDIAGDVVEVGCKVKGFKVGDRIMGSLADSGFGGLAELVAVSPDYVVKISDNVSYESAAASAMPATVALQALRDKGQIRPGESVAINGASGGVGTAAIQIAKSLGAEVTAICSKRNTEAAREFGADRIIDYGKEDFTKDDTKYDIVLGVNGYHPISSYERVLKDNGTYVMIGGASKQIFEGVAIGPMKYKNSTKTMTSLDSKPNKDDLLSVAKFLEEGQVVPVIDRVFNIAETAQAFQYYGDGKAKGKVVIVL